jgi:hypothetical protein
VDGARRVHHRPASWQIDPALPHRAIEICGRTRDVP